jgi:DNA-binding XRE family transcriptional regulator
MSGLHCEPVNPVLAACLRDARKRLGWTQGQLADAVGVQAKTIGRLERGEPVTRVVRVAVSAVLRGRARAQ